MLQLIPWRLAVDMRLCGRVWGRFMPLVLLYRPHALHR